VRADQLFTVPPGMVLNLRCDGSDADSDAVHVTKDPFFNW